MEAIRTRNRLQYVPILHGRALREYQTFMNRHNLGLRPLPLRGDNGSYTIRFRVEPGQLVRQDTVTGRIVNILRNEFHFTGRMAGRVTVQPVATTTDEMFILGSGIGGASAISRQFVAVVVSQLHVGNVLETLQEREYYFVNMGDLIWEVSFPLTNQLLDRLVNGGTFHTATMKIPDHLFLYNYEHWSLSAKTKLALGLKQLRHLKLLRGLYFYKAPTNPSIVAEDVCGYIALMYAIELAKYRRGEAHLLTKWESNNDTMYADVKEYFKLNSHEEVIPMSMGALKEYVEDLCPDHQLVVWDTNRGHFPRYNGSQFIAPYLDRFSHNSLMYEQWDQWTLYSLYICYDQREHHFLPIFNAKLFFKPSRTRPSIPCPQCLKVVRKDNLNTHRCTQYECAICCTSFDSLEDLEGHELGSGELTWRCPGCATSIHTKECYDKHTLLCVGEAYEACEHCKKIVAETDMDRHACPRIHCKKCRVHVVEPRVMDVEKMKEWGDYCQYLERHQQPVPTLPHSVFRYYEKHQCRAYTRPQKENTKMGATVYAFDFECRLDPVSSTHPRFAYLNALGHTMNMGCGFRLNRFSETGEEEAGQSDDCFVVSTMEEFWTAVLERSAGGSTVWYAHNLSGYDGHFIIDFLREKEIMIEWFIEVGLKLKAFNVRHPHTGTKIKFKDSLLLLGMALSKIPTAFRNYKNLSDLKKGCFPYLFNTLANQGYVGPLPPRELFGVVSMSKPELQSFEEWYSEKEQQPYSLYEEMKTYCVQDTLILKLGLEAYQQVCLQTVGMDPLIALTRAQFTYDVYVKKCMPPRVLPMLDQNESDFARRAFRGGRTDVRCMRYVQSDEDRQQGIHLAYVDIQSLYPTVQYYDRLPVGRPRRTRYTADVPQPSLYHLKNFFGVICCDVRPTCFLFHPILSHHRQGKLVSSLQPLRYYHTTSIELQKALENGYVVDHVYRIDEYDWSTDLFKKYVRLWLKMKVISSKPPAHVEETIQKWASGFEIEITPDEFVENACVRQIAKDMLNNLWGKFGQHEDLVKCDVITNTATNAEHEHRIRTKKRFEVERSQFTATCILVKYRERFCRPKKYSPIAAFVTANAWMRLWKELDRLGDRVYYHDTDSIIYKFVPGQYNVKIGSMLGDWEVENSGMPIHRFTAIAPKMYAIEMKAADGTCHSVTKGKGFRFNSATAFTIDDYDRILDSPGFELSLFIEQTQFERILDTGTPMVTYQFNKKASMNCNKGLVDLETGRVYPFGTTHFLRNAALRWHNVEDEEVPDEKPRLRWLWQTDVKVEQDWGDAETVVEEFGFNDASHES